MNDMQTFVVNVPKAHLKATYLSYVEPYEVAPE